MKRGWMLILPVVIAACFTACKERFDPRLAPSQTGFLVVEGFINTRGSTTIRLGRSVPLKDSTKIKAELNATVTITGEDNSVYNVRSKGGGFYVSDSLVLNNSQKYRIHIKTSAGRDYFSEYNAVKQSPPIDSVSWKLKDNHAIQVYVSTHDPQNNTRYYKWDYEETWEIHSAFLSYYSYSNGVVSPRPVGDIDRLYYCWKNENSSSILLGSSAQLSNDVIQTSPISLIPPNSEKSSVRYSILVKQYAMDRKAYDFFQLMRSNTETLGSIFDALPSETTGNITCVSNPSEKVIGYVAVSSISQKRIFILRSDIYSAYTPNCETVFVPNNRDSIKLYYDVLGLSPYQAEFAGVITGYYSSTRGCIDCTLSGTNVKPSFW